MSYIFLIKRKKFLIWIITACFLMNIFLGGCSKSLNTGGKKEEVDYVICKESGLPEQLKDLLEKKKKSPGTFAFKNSMYTYLVVCYGPQEYSGYSIKVEECCRTEDALYLKTQLVGPSGAEPVIKTETFPYIVLRCDRTDIICIIDS